MNGSIDQQTRLRWSYQALDAAIARYNDTRGARPDEAFAAAAEAAFWSATLNDFHWKRHPRNVEYVDLRDRDKDGQTVRALALYRNRIAHSIEVRHEGMRSGFSDAYSDEFVKYSHYFLALDEVSFEDVGRPPHRDAKGKEIYADHVAGREIRDVLAQVERWWARCRVEFAEPATDAAG